MVLRVLSITRMFDRIIRLLKWLYVMLKSLQRKTSSRRRRRKFAFCRDGSSQTSTSRVQRFVPSIESATEGMFYFISFSFNSLFASLSYPFLSLQNNRDTPTRFKNDTQNQIRPSHIPSLFSACLQPNPFSRHIYGVPTAIWPSPTMPLLTVGPSYPPFSVTPFPTHNIVPFRHPINRLSWTSHTFYQTFCITYFTFTLYTLVDCETMTKHCGSRCSKESVLIGVFSQIRQIFLVLLCCLSPFISLLCHICDTLLFLCGLLCVLILRLLNVLFVLSYPSYRFVVTFLNC